MTKPDQSNDRGDDATKRVEASLREALESRLEALPPEVTQRLAESRQAALTRRSRAYWRRPAVGGLALAASVLLAVILIGQGTRETTPGQDVPGQHAAGAEGLARMLYAAHCGWTNIVGSNPIGVWNIVLLVLGGMFGLSKIGENLHSIYNRNTYIDYVEEQKRQGIV